MAKFIDKNYYHIYIAYYKNRIIAVSEDKKVIKNYMGIHRGLDKHLYYIEDDYASDADMIVKYEDYIIEEYNGFYIPRIDGVIIDMSIASLNDELSSLINHIKRFTLLISHLKKSGDDVDALVSAIKILSSYSAKKKYKKLRKESVKSHSILYCDIESYLKQVRSFQEMRDMHNAYNNAWMND